MQIFWVWDIDLSVVWFGMYYVTLLFTTFLICIVSLIRVLSTAGAWKFNKLILAYQSNQYLVQSCCIMWKDLMPCLANKQLKFSDAKFTNQGHTVKILRNIKSAPWELNIVLIFFVILHLIKNSLEWNKIKNSLKCICPYFLFCPLVSNAEIRPSVLIQTPP